MMLQADVSTYGQVMSRAAELARFRPPADVIIAVGLVCAISEPGLDPYHHDGGFWWAFGGVAAGAVLAWRRTRPGGVWAISTVLTAVLLVNRRGGDLGGVSPLILLPGAVLALYTVAERTTRNRATAALAVSVILLGAGLLSHPARPETVATTAALLVMAWSLGEGARARREGLAALRGRAAALESEAAALESERAERDRRAAAEERSRIARELHDIVAHHVSVISLQAGTARMLAEAGQPADAGLLAGIETTSRQAMTDLRLALGVIRHTADGSRPAPGLAQLPALAGQMSRAGLSVTIEGAPGPGPLPGPLDLAAYRVVQEGLTNVLRHSWARSALVTLAGRDGRLEVTITDDGPVRDRAAVRDQGGDRDDGTGGGFGLIGVRQRAAALGGSVTACPRPAGGFELRAVLPLTGPLQKLSASAVAGPGAAEPDPAA